MPQMNKGGKFIFGKSLIRDDLTVHLPPQALTEYSAAKEEKVYLFTGSKVTGGFCVTRKGLLEPSKLGHILTELPSSESWNGTAVHPKQRYCFYNGCNRSSVGKSRPL